MWQGFDMMLILLELVRTRSMNFDDARGPIQDGTWAVEGLVAHTHFLESPLKAG